MSDPTALRADIAGLGFKGKCQGGDIELRVMGQDYQRRVAAQRHLRQRFLRPGMDQPFGIWETFRCCQCAAGVDDNHLKTHLRGHAAQGDGRVRGPDDYEVGRGTKHLEKHPCLLPLPGQGDYFRPSDLQKLVALLGYPAIERRGY